jgi:phosphoglycolate phosphatase
LSFNTSKQAGRENKYKAIIFDWDGTLVDSTARIVDAMQMAIVENAMPVLTDHAIQQIIGLGLPEALKVLWPNITDAQSLQMQKCYVAKLSHHSKISVDFFNQAHEIFEQLKQLGYVLAVATGKTRRGLDEMLDGMDVRDVFDITRCADETASKPDPKMLQEILNELNITHQQALMVGDTSFDLDMAKNINMDSIGMTHGAHESKILTASGAKALCHDLTDLLDWIKKNG